MSSHGRGRGRGWASIQDSDSLLRRPGEIVSSITLRETEKNIVEMINGLTTQLNSSRKIQEIVELVRNLTVDEESFTSIFEKLYRLALSDKHFVIKLAILFSDKTFSNIEYENSKSMRYLLLHTLQDDYTRKDEIRSQNAEKFRNSISLLGEIYFRMRFFGDDPLIVLELPLINYWDMLLENPTEEDIKLLALQIMINSKTIYNRHQLALDKLLLNVRKILVKDSCSSTSKWLLLLIIDVTNKQYMDLNDDLRELYESHIDSTFFIDVKEHLDDLRIIIKAKDNEVRNDHSLEKSALTENAVQQLECRTTTMNISKQERTAAPRAIRGSGAGDASKDQKVRSKSYVKNKAWEHDDRFEKDY